ncbi:(P)ppGpp synthetase [Tenacibaculum sp. 190130A14a]|uniref:GTP pyrophosphokinase n=1 Tax=Tenacibaculum polynesiense TaxID=3137857 RepID=A0ABP1EW28_9FLAO
MTKKEDTPEKNIKVSKNSLEEHVYKLKYDQEKQQYDNLGNNVVNALKKFLDDNNIGYLEIYYRVKDTNSFLEKIDRKNYEDPFNEMEDICGIRIICYYPDDINRIRSIISKEFEIVEDSDKSNLLKEKEFGYRSHHFIARIKKEWTQAPNYRDLVKLKFEIQVRTVLMHAWAEIAHKLNYKTEDEVPSAYKRKLFVLSALLENADDQFDNLRKEILGYKEHIKEEIKTNKGFDTNQEFNIETFKEFLKLHYDDLFTWKERDLNNLYGKFILLNIGFKDINHSITLVKEYNEEIKADIFKFFPTLMRYMGIVHLLFIMDVTNDKFYKNRKGTELFIDWIELVEHWKAKIKK